VVTSVSPNCEILAVAPLELDDGVRLREAVGRLLLLGDAAGLPAELERRQAVAVHRGGHVCGVGIE